MWTLKDWLLKIILPCGLLGLLIHGIVTRTALISAEIPVEGRVESLPLDKNMCPPDPQQGVTPTHL